MLAEGNVLLNADLSQAELRCMAIFSGDEWMINALQEGQGDFFDNHLMPVAYPNIVDEWDGIENFKKQEPVLHKEARTKVKAVQYGLAFGRQAPAIAASLNMPVADANKIIRNYLFTANGFREWREQVMEAAVNPAKRDMLVNPFGRRFQSEIVTQHNYKNVQREALSFLPQSTSSDICLAAAIKINAWLKERPEFRYKIINIVHDAIMLEGPEYEADIVGDFVSQTLRETGALVMGDAVPFLSEYSTGRTWADLD